MGWGWGSGSLARVEPRFAGALARREALLEHALRRMRLCGGSLEPLHPPPRYEERP